MQKTNEVSERTLLIPRKGGRMKLVASDKNISTLHRYKQKESTLVHFPCALYAYEDNLSKRTSALVLFVLVIMLILVFILFSLAYVSIMLMSLVKTIL